jgi:hypothetical protein
MTKGSSNYEKVRRILKQRLNEPSVRLKGQYSIRLYQWAKQYLAVGYKRISITLLFSFVFMVLSNRMLFTLSLWAIKHVSALWASDEFLGIVFRSRVSSNRHFARQLDRNAATH